MANDRQVKKSKSDFVPRDFAPARSFFFPFIGEIFLPRSLRHFETRDFLAAPVSQADVD